MNDNKYMNKYMKERWIKRKAKYIEQLGGMCVDCGSDTDLQFDHVDPSTKSFTIARGASFSEARLQEELLKCELRCKPCHIRKSKIDGSTFKNKAVGEHVNFAKLNEQDVIEILAATGTHQSIADRFNVSRSTVSQIKRRIIWKHLSS